MPIGLRKEVLAAFRVSGFSGPSEHFRKGSSQQLPDKQVFDCEGFLCASGRNAADPHSAVQLTFSTPYPGEYNLAEQF